MMKGMAAGHAPSPGHCWMLAGPWQGPSPRADLLGAQRWALGFVCPGPVSLHALCQCAFVPAVLEPFPEYPQVARGCPSSTISSAQLVGQVLPKGRRSSRSGKEPLSPADLGSVPASALRLPEQSWCISGQGVLFLWVTQPCEPPRHSLAPC